MGLILLVQLLMSSDCYTSKIVMETEALIKNIVGQKKKKEKIRLYIIDAINSN